MGKVKPGIYGIALIVAVALVAGVVMMRASSAKAPAPRDVRIVARDMAFYVEGNDQPNPTLRFRAGEEIRLVFRNEDEGMNHDFTIGTWGVGTKLLEGTGENAVTFRVPETHGSEPYVCTPHSQMMQGIVEVR